MTAEVPIQGPVVEVSAALDRAAGVLGSAETVALCGHVNPDPDALGSMFGLATFLRARGSQVVCSWPNEPLEMPRWLDLFDDVPPVVSIASFPKEPAVMVALDTASPDRLAALLPNAERAGVLVVLDHHASNPGFGDVLILDPAATSTAEVAYRLMGRIGGAIPDQAAAFLYAGMITDTGRFQYQAVTPETLRVAADLRTFGFDHARLARALYEDSSIAALRLTGRALERLTLVPEADLIWTHLTHADLAATGAQLSETDDLVDAVRMAREADVACVIKEQRDGKLKVSLRSRGATDVGGVAVALGGGGHRLAAGYTSRVNLEGSVRALIDALHAVRGAER
jgi:bifunctional oligoribonuclease and PAP phosphatase NrnA